jgi:hypothetical protein
MMIFKEWFREWCYTPASSQPIPDLDLRFLRQRLRREKEDGDDVTMT